MTGTDVRSVNDRARRRLGDRVEAVSPVGRPDFVIVGGTDPNDPAGVVLVASTELTYATVVASFRETIELAQMTKGWALTGAFLEVRVGVDQYVVIRAASYLDGFAILFGRWSPGRGRVPLAIEAGAAVEQ